MTEAHGLTAPPVLYDRSDYAALQKLSVRRALPLLMFVVFMLLLVVFLLLLLVYLLEGRIFWRETIVALFALAVFVLLAGFIPGLKTRLMMRAARDTGATLPQTFTAGEEFWRAESDRGVTQLRWSSVPRIERQPDRLFVFNGPRTAFMVPRRVFADDAAFETFAATVEQYWKKGR